MTVLSDDIDRMLDKAAAEVNSGSCLTPEASRYAVTVAWAEQQTARIMREVQASIEVNQNNNGGNDGS